MDLTKTLSEYDSIRYRQSGQLYDGFITKVNKDFIEGRFCEADEDFYGDKKGVFFNAIIYKQSFKGLNLEWFYEGQGGDNSAIGCSGWWEEFKVA
tara:strand:+ start:153 stop:437 length:285 start_codon:yes stop_codon:yes gene_type:complete